MSAKWKYKENDFTIIFSSFSYFYICYLGPSIFYVQSNFFLTFYLFKIRILEIFLFDLLATKNMSRSLNILYDRPWLVVIRGKLSQSRVKKRVLERVLQRVMHILRSETLGRRLANAKSLAKSLAESLIKSLAETLSETLGETFGETLGEIFRVPQASPQSLGSDYMHGSP